MKNTKQIKKTTWINTISDVTDDPKEWVALPVAIKHEDAVVVFDAFGDKITISTERNDV